MLIRTIGIISIIGSLSACQTTSMPVTEGPDANAVAVDITDLRDSYLAANPGAEGLPLLNSNKQGFVIKSDGTIRYNAFFASSNLFYITEITVDEGNLMCMAKTEYWSGACMKLFRMGDGSYQVSYKFGNGAGSSYTARSLTD